MTATTVTATIALRPQDLAFLAEFDPNGVAASVGDDEITNFDLDRWSNRLARIILALGARPGTAVAIALDPSIESVVVSWALAKIGTVGITSSASVPSASIGVTTRNRHADLSASVNWLILDEPATMRRYMTADDAALEAANVAA